MAIQGIGILLLFQLSLLYKFYLVFKRHLVVRRRIATNGSVHRSHHTLETYSKATVPVTGQTCHCLRKHSDETRSVEQFV